MRVGDRKRKCAKIKKLNARDLTPNDCLKNRRKMHERDYKKEKKSEALFM